MISNYNFPFSLSFWHCNPNTWFPNTNYEYRRAYEEWTEKRYISQQEIKNSLCMSVFLVGVFFLHGNRIKIDCVHVFDYHIALVYILCSSPYSPSNLKKKKKGTKWNCIGESINKKSKKENKIEVMLYTLYTNAYPLTYLLLTKLCARTYIEPPPSQPNCCVWVPFHLFPMSICPIAIDKIHGIYI